MIEGDDIIIYQGPIVEPVGNGSIYATVGPMFSQKSTEAQRLRKAAIFRRQEAVLLIPAMDTRYSKQSLNVSHDGSYMSAMRVSDLATVKIDYNVQIVIIDEAQFMPGLADFCLRQKRCGRVVHVFGLQSDKDGNAWPEISKLIVTHHDQIDKITYCYADCIVCCERAAYNIKVSGDKNTLVELGGDDLYAPVCYEHYLEQSTVTGDVINRRKLDVARVNELKKSE